MIKSSVKPKQQVSYKEKIKNDNEWFKNTAGYYSGACVQAIDPALELQLYKLAIGELDESDYTYVTNPLNTTRPELRGYPARLVNYDIVSPNFNTLMGEKASRFFNPVVVARNSRFEKIKLNLQKKLYVTELQKIFINDLIKQGIQFEQEQLQENLNQVANTIKNLPDEMAIIGQNSIGYIMDYNELPRLLRKGFYDYITTGMSFSYKDVMHDRTIYNIIAPSRIKYLCSEDIDFLEDGEAVTVTYYMTNGQIYDKFQDDPNFDKDIKDYLTLHEDQSTKEEDGYYTSMSDRDSHTNQLFRNVFGASPSDYRYNELGIPVEHVMWRGSTKVGKLVYYDIYGEEHIEYVDESFVPTEGEYIEWRWVDEIFETWIVDDKFYLGMQSVPIQRAEYNAPNKCKLLYNGIGLTTRRVRPKGLAEKSRPYQKSVNIIKYRMEETLAKNMDKLMIIPLSMISKKEGWTEDKVMYYARAFSFLFLDDSNKNFAAAVSALKGVDMSLAKYVIEANRLIQDIKMEWDELCGINPQRKAQISNSAGKGTTDIAVQRSHVMSEEMFLRYEEFEQREYTGMLNLSKYAFNDGIEEAYIKPDGTQGYLSINDPATYQETNFGIFVKNGSKELQKLETLRAQMQAFAQNQVDPKSVAKLIEAENFSEIHKIMDELSDKMDAIRERELKSQEAVQQSVEKVSNQELEFEYYKVDKEADTDIQVELIKKNLELINMLTTPETAKNISSDMMVERKGELEANMLELLKLANERKAIESKERMNKDNNRTKLLNKVSGEK